MSARTLLLLLLLHAQLLLSGRVAFAGPYAQVEVEGWTWSQGSRTRAATDSGSSLGVRLNLSEEIRLEAFAAAAPARGVGYGEATWGALRLGAGAIGDDAAVHLGYGPTFAVQVHERVRLQGGLDVSVGGAWLGEVEARGSWGADVFAGRAALRGSAIFQPWARLTLSLGAFADVTVALAPPRPDPLIESASRLSDRLDVGLLGALSQGAVGAWGEARLEVLRGRPRRDVALSVDLSYREAWDWIHLDPTATFLSRTELLGDVSPGPTPWRTKRSVGLDLRGSWDDGRRASLGLDLQHVRGSTTSLEFGDRDGWSLGARLGLSLGRVEGAVSARYHLQSDPLEGYWGSIPRGQVGLELGAVLYEGADVAVHLVGRGRWTVEDAFGVPREGYAFAAAVEIGFGGAPSRRILGRGHEVLVQSRPALPASPGLLELALTSAKGARALDRAPRLARRGAEALRRPGALPSEEWVASSRPEALISEGGGALRDPRALGPGALVALRERLKDLATEIGLDEQDLRAPKREVVIQKVLRSLKPALAVGYGRGGVRLAPIRSASRHAFRSRLEPLPRGSGSIARVLGVTTRWNPSDAETVGAQLSALLGQPSPLAGVSLEAFSDGGVEAFSLYVPRGRRYALAFQGRSAWARFMQRALTGRRQPPGGR